jgi:DNA polymerase-3 subunit epsilon
MERNLSLSFWTSPPWVDVTYWALDLETGGLDPGRDAILAVGMVPLRAGTIRLGEAYETLVRPADTGGIRPESVRTHQLVPRDVSDAPPIGEALREIDERLRGGAALLVHQAAIDVRFLRAAYGAEGLRWPRPTVVDTVELLVKAVRKRRFLDPTSQQRDPVLNLAEARRRFGLPEYGAHDALTDAIATAELFLVLRKVVGARTLRDLR